MVAIIRAKRTAIGKFNGMYKDESLVDFSSKLLKDISKNLEIDEVILGNVLSSNLGQALSRQVTIKAGLDISIPSFIVNMVCGSGMKAIELAYYNILANKDKCIVAGGMEKMTDSQNMLKDGLIDSFSNNHMGLLTEDIVRKYDFSRESLDDFSYNSQLKAIKAIKDGKYNEEIYDNSKDEFPRFDIDREKLKKLKPCFKEDGYITAANTTGLNDGAALLVLMDENRAKEENVEILAKIKDIVSVGIDPNFMGLGPICSTKKLLEKHNLSVEEIDLFEINEAFAAVVLAYIKELNIDEKKVNVNGGAISLGHPIGASGARIVVTLVHELKRRKLKRAIACLCIGGGQGISILIERD